MPHDFNNQPLKPGDRVFVPCIVQNVHQTENDEYCNATLVTEYPMPGTDQRKNTLTLNTKQTLLMAEDVGMVNLREAQEHQAQDEAAAKENKDLKKADKLNNDPAK